MILVLCALSLGFLIGCLVSDNIEALLYATAVFISFAICEIILLAVTPDVVVIEK
jgi:hypothetical protein